MYLKCTEITISNSTCNWTQSGVQFRESNQLSNFKSAKTKHEYDLKLRALITPELYDTKLLNN